MKFVLDVSTGGNVKRKIKYTARDSRPHIQGPRREVRLENNTVRYKQVLSGNSLKIC